MRLGDLDVALLPEALAEAGIAVGDVDTVVLTHLHTDHVGWAVVGDRPYFGNARYVLPRGDVEVVRLGQFDRLAGGVLASAHLSRGFVPLPAPPPPPPR
jgi:glyoxylase-like metal-dependent hydrolase (beta-lactamase superfamily II)